MRDNLHESSQQDVTKMYLRLGLFSASNSHRLLKPSETLGALFSTNGPILVVQSLQEGSCHLRELELCTVSSMSLFQNPNGLPIEEAQLKRQCEILGEGSRCFEDFGERCLTTQQFSMAEMFLGGLFGLQEEFCANGSEFRKDYMKQANCLRKVQLKYHNGCMMDFQAGFESIHKSVGIGSRFNQACCNFNRMKDCILPHVEKECGETAMGLIEVIFQQTLGAFLHVTCRNHDPLSENCTSILPKPGTKPTGARNTSVISRALSAYLLRPS